MSVPAQRRTAAHRRRRQSHNALKHKSLTTCDKCGTKKLPHIACAVCGTYRGRQVLTAASVRQARNAKKTTAARPAKKETERK
ncbi:50S ribosomal protein L32 [Candidatus Uhrbacteria bacterium CG10_big_fil_rev_8_21_14_0_10_48_11]|uniref:Large ribosomal subunit protein bL32 n=1 Tax=Candidatus Uhrbacteria bacterium CG10_big_fil_rev_8_21_14_0_10_48_11 TaxID=1975037 RepID=A0A2M8LEQ9_9BACT|nr:MAG: 50S ribosomal protein L32 [Candidatus Uhrbacteria bacterium CG10_big_fil_rev_8_21_14_0_10_48_11]